MTASCTSKKKIVSDTGQKLDQGQVMNIIQRHNITASHFNATGDISVDSPDQSISGTFDLRMKTDSAIVVAAKKFGIEAIRLLVTPRDYTMLYRLESVYTQEPISALARLAKIDLNYNDVAQLVLGNVLMIDPRQAIVEQQGNLYIVSGQSDDLQVSYTIDGANQQITQTKYTDDQGRIITLDFSDYRKMGSKAIAHARVISLIDNNGTSTVTIEADVIEIDKSRSIKFSIPTGYDRI
jgi:hypothetical protein